MARANLVVDAELQTLFVGASKRTPPLRWIKAEIRDVTIFAVDSAPVQGDAAADLETVKGGVLEGSGPCFVLFCPEPDQERNAWVLIAYVPDNSKVRARMLYASGQDDVKRAFGHSNFAGSAHVTEPGELSLDTLRGNVKRNLADAPLTDAEILAKEEVAQMAAPSEARANAMGLVPFSFGGPLDERLKAFVAGSCDLVEAKVEGDDRVVLGSEKGPGLSKSNIARDEPRFYVLRQPATGNVYLVFSCPTSTKIRKRMLYSTCKQTLMHHITGLGVEVNKTLEIGDPDDIEDMLELHERPDENQGKIVQQAFSKPARPGRGKARIAKKE